jgi:NADH:ubiquinone reductase (non-electrogenic)
MFEVVVVSPRNHFLFTPMLPSTAVGTVEFRSLLEPVRLSNPFVNYIEAACDKLDVEKKVAYCTSAIPFKDGQRPQFEIPYDICVVAVGEKPATFGTPGVEEHCFFMKEVGARHWERGSNYKSAESKSCLWRSSAF